MSILNQLFNRGVFGAKCKTCLSLAISRIKLLQNKRDMQLIHMRKEISEFLRAGQEAIAHIRVEHVMREQNLRVAYEILELFSEFVLARLPILDSQRECPAEMREAVATLIFAAPRCSDVPDLIHVRNLFGAKYGKEFVMIVSELRPDSGVNRTIIESLSVSIPSVEGKLKVLLDIAKEYNVDWDCSNTEAEFSKKHEDLLGGSKQMFEDRSRVLLHAGTYSSTSKERQVLQPPSPTSRVPKLGNGVKAFAGYVSEATVADVKNDRREQSCDVLEKARVAIASAERASAAARAAAELVHGNFGSLNVKGQT